jgi:hypothetical protein|tara:strand:- start:6809 stop:7954 length:1146 start_codon:yes stop_codon:yes gene_type:complete
MADPISLVAIAGLVYAGRSLSSKSTPPKVIQPKVQSAQIPLPVNDDVPDFIDREFAPRVEVPHKVEVSSFADIGVQHKSSGQEVLNMRNRMYDTGHMNNLSPVEKQMVGPGLGVGENTPASGGFQQMLRINPVNVGEYRLTTLPGRSGPAADTTGGRRTGFGDMTHNKPETTSFLPSRRPTMAGRAQGMSGAIPRASQQKTMRTTNRSETGMRNDGLGFNGAKRFISAQTVSQDPTRFKTDRNDDQYQYYNQPAPGITNFRGAYTDSAASKVTDKTNEQLMKYGFRAEDRRGKPNRMGNAGRMNVRESALKTGGALTSVRSDTTRIDGRMNAANGGWTQQYQQKPYHQLNAYKGNANPNTNHLNIAKRQLQNNPLAHSLSQ